VEGSQWGAPDIYHQKGYQWSKDPSNKALQGTRDDIGESRGMETKGMRDMWDRALGKTSYASQMGAKQVASTQAGALSQAKGVAGRYNPAASRAANTAVANAPQAAAAGIDYAKQAEQIGALQSYQKAAQGIRGQDIGQFSNEMDWWQNQADWNKDKSGMALGWEGAGLADKESEMLSWEELEAQRLKAQKAGWGLAADEQARGLRFFGDNLEATGNLIPTGK
jgi:hypothetical protein